jgi:hypothetical protein
MKSYIITHLATAVLFGLIVLLIYAAVQQTYRTAARNPQTELARNTPNGIKYSRTYYFISDSGVDAQQSSGTFRQLYNQNGQLIYSGGTIKGKAPHSTEHVLNNAKYCTESAVTGERPTDTESTDIAAYTTMPDIAFVVVTRSLHVAENFEIRLITMIILFWAVGCGIIAMHWLVQKNIK